MEMGWNEYVELIEVEYLRGVVSLLCIYIYIDIYVHKYAYIINSHTIHVWYIYLDLPLNSTNCR